MKLRIALLDAWRGLAILGMIVYHLLFDLLLFGVLTEQQMFSLPMQLFQQAICWSFILLAGASSCFSRNNYRRGIITLAVGLLIMLGGEFVGQPIRFGILQCLGFCMLLYGLLQKPLSRLHPAWSILWMGLFGLFYWLTRHVVAPVGWLYPFGFLAPDFYSADYFGLLPWFFLFLAGAGMGKKLRAAAQKQPTPAWARCRSPAWLCWIGRHSLWIYLFHQPVLYGVTWLIFR